MDRRARGESGDTAPYAPEREAEDLATVIDAIGGDAAVVGHSSGAVLTSKARPSRPGRRRRCRGRRALCGWGAAPFAVR